MTIEMRLRHRTTRESDSMLYKGFIETPAHTPNISEVFGIRSRRAYLHLQDNGLLFYSNNHSL